MQFFWAYFFGVLALASALAIGIAGRKLSQSNKRVSRSYAPIAVKVQSLSVEVSALRRSRSDRQRRLDVEHPIEIEVEE
jgi:hypothetical protein